MLAPLSSTSIKLHPAVLHSLPFTFSWAESVELASVCLLATVPIKNVTSWTWHLQTLAASVQRSYGKCIQSNTGVSLNLTLKRRLWPWEAVCTHPPPWRDPFRRALVLLAPWVSTASRTTS